MGTLGKSRNTREVVLLGGWGSALNVCTRPHHRLLTCSGVFLKCAITKAGMEMALEKGVRNLQGHILIVSKIRDIAVLCSWNRGGVEGFVKESPSPRKICHIPGPTIR